MSRRLCLWIAHCPLLQGVPQTSGLRNGFLRLKPGATVGWHTTGQNEETLVILHGKGRAEIEGPAAMPVAEKMIAYIPPATRHNVKNTGTEPNTFTWSRPQPKNNSRAIGRGIRTNLLSHLRRKRDASSGYRIQENREFISFQALRRSRIGSFNSFRLRFSLRIFLTIFSGICS